jgi:transposase
MSSGKEREGLSYKNFAEAKLANPKSKRNAMENEFAAFVAVDWADQKHAWMIRIGESGERRGGTIDHTPEAVDVWAAELRLQFGGQPLAVAVEQSRGSLVFMLSKYEHLVVFPVHPTTLANYRKSFRPSGAKNDPSDAALLLDVLTLHRDKLRALTPDTPDTRTLQFLVEERRKLVDEKTRCSNRITSHLKMYFPQVLDWFDEIGSAIAAEFLERWPDLEKLKRAKPATIQQFFFDHNSRNSERLAERLEQIRKSIAATSDAAVLTSCRSAVVAWAGLMKELVKAISRYDKQIETLARQHPDYALMKSFPGAGDVLAPRLIAAIGSQRDRYMTAHQLQCYSGIAPVVASSGRQHWVHWRWSCPKFLRQTFQEWALRSIAYSTWARSYYDGQRAKGKACNTAVRALAFKWIRILFRCWKDHKPYDEALYESKLSTHCVDKQTPERVVDLQWKTIAGFRKLVASGS